MLLYLLANEKVNKQGRHTFRRVSGFAIMIWVIEAEYGKEHTMSVSGAHLAKSVYRLAVRTGRCWPSRRSCIG